MLTNVSMSYPRYVNSFFCRAVVVESRLRAFRRLAFGVMNDFFFLRPIHQHLILACRDLVPCGVGQSNQPWHPEGCFEQLSLSVDSLVVSTTVWVIHRVHGNTANMREEFTTSLGLVVSSTCSSQRHLITAMTSEHTDGGSTGAGSSLREPDGIRIRTLSPSLASTTQEFPAERATLPPSPGRSSTLLMAVPSGISESGVMFPGRRETLSPMAIWLPIATPSVATTSVVSPSGSFTRANGLCGQVSEPIL